MLQSARLSSKQEEVKQNYIKLRSRGAATKARRYTPAKELVVKATRERAEACAMRRAPMLEHVTSGTRRHTRLESAIALAYPMLASMLALH